MPSVWLSDVGTAADLYDVSRLRLQRRADPGRHSRGAIAMTPRPVTRYVPRLLCPQCSRGFYAAVPLILPQACPACAGGRLQPGAVWDLARANKC